MCTHNFFGGTLAGGVVVKIEVDLFIVGQEGEHMFDLYIPGKLKCSLFYSVH